LAIEQNFVLSPEAVRRNARTCLCARTSSTYSPKGISDDAHRNEARNEPKPGMETKHRSATHLFFEILWLPKDEHHHFSDLYYALGLNEPKCHHNSTSFEFSTSYIIVYVASEMRNTFRWPHNAFICNCEAHFSCGDAECCNE